MGGQIDWDPRRSTIGTAVTQSPAKAWEQVKSNLNPMDSSAGKLLSGNLGGFQNDLLGGAQGLFRGNLDAMGAALTGLPGALNAQQGREAEGRQQQDVASASANDATQAAQIQAQRKRQQDEESAMKANMDYQAGQARQASESQAADAFTAARNAARKAKGNKLFGAWGA